MKKTTFLLASAALSLAATTQAAEVSTDPVGYITLDIAGAGEGNEAFSFLSASLQKGAEFSGAVSSSGANSITVDSAGWEANSFSSGCYVHLSNGYIASIASNTTDTLTTVEDLSSFITGGETLVIREYLTIADIFGASNEAGFLSAGAVGDSDEVMIPDGVGGFDRYFYMNNARLGQGWRLSTDLATDAALTPIPVGQGIVVKRKGAEGISVTLAGSVITSDVAVYPLEEGFNFLSTAYPVDYTLGSFFGANGGDLASGASFADADQVFVQNAEGGFDSYFYMDNPRLGQGWRKSDDLVSDAAGVEISLAGEGVIVNRRAEAANFAEAKPF